MPPLFDSIPEWVTIATFITVGVFALIGILDRAFRDRNKEKTSLEDKIRVLYQEESKALAEKVEELTKEVAVLRTENGVITKIFQGRDDQTVEFQKMGFETMKQFSITNQMIFETNSIAKDNKNGLSKMSKNIENMVKILEKHLIAESKRTSVSMPKGAEITVKDNR